MLFDVQVIFLVIFSMLLTPSVFSYLAKLGTEELTSSETSVLDTGQGPLGLFLGHSITRLPILRKHYRFKIHHYYHNRQKVLKEVHIRPQDVTLCEGNSGGFCPNGTWTLCTKNGAVRCVSSLWETQQCDQGQFQHCALAVLPCIFYTPECGGLRVGNSFETKIPCISLAKIYVNLVYVNGTVIAQDLLKIYPPEMFCVTVLALPAKLSKGEELFEAANRLFEEFAAKVN